MVASISKVTTGKYYIDVNSYYITGDMVPGRWITVGFDAAELTVGDLVEHPAFQRLLDAHGLSGKSLLRQVFQARVPGFDITFSASKSVSTIWALADPVLRRQINSAQEYAVAAGIQILRDHSAFVRAGHNGVHLEKTQLTIAAFPQGEARPAEHADGRVYSDPQLHTHTVVINLGPKEPWPRNEPCYGALDGRAL